MPPQDPQGNVNTNAMMIDAMTALTRQLQRNLDLYQQEHEQQRAQPPGVQPIYGQMGLFNPNLNPEAPRSRSGPEGQAQLFNPGAYPSTGPQPYSPGDTYLRYPPNQPGDDFRSRAGQAWNTFRESGARHALGEWSGRLASTDTPDSWASGGSLPGQGDPGDGLPPTATSTGSMPAGPPTGPGGMRGGNNISDAGMLSWAVLGEHGGPAFVRNLAMEQWGLQRSLSWAQNNVQNLQDRLPEGFDRFGINSQNLSSLGDVLDIATQHPLATYAAYKVGSSALGGIRGLVNTGQNWQDVGAQLGVPVTPDRFIFGRQNPLAPFLSASTSVGAGAAINRRQLMGELPGGMGMGSGLSGDEATQAIHAIVGQGFGGNENALGGGDIGAIANQFMGPLLQQFPGMSPNDLAQFLPMLRNSGTSLTQLTNTLSDLGTAAQATHETVGQAASSLQSFAEQTRGMGSAQGALTAGQTFRNITGMDPQIQAQMLQNPLTQGLAMSRFGVLPSGLTDMNQGVLTGLSTQALNMLMNATRGLDQNLYANVNGQRTLIQSGRDRQIDQVAQMMGIQPNEARRLLSQEAGNSAREQLMTALTGPGGFINMTRGGAGQENAQERSTAQQYWMRNIAPHWQGTGIGQTEMHRLSNEGFQKRIRDLQNDMNRAQSKTTWGATQRTPSAQTVNVQFTGAAAKFFQQIGPTTAKQAANAGKLTNGIAGIANSITGDITSSGIVNDLINPANQLGLAEGAVSGVADAIGSIF